MTPTSLSPKNAVTDKKLTLTQEQINQYHALGFLIVPGMFSAEELKPLQDACENDPALWEEETEYVYSNQKTNRVMIYHTLSDSFLGAMPRLERMVDSAESILGEECYHWHSKLVRKEPHSEGVVEWHQGYGSWYHYGCLFPTTLTTAIAITDNTRENGCMQVIEKSHLMGRFNHQRIGSTDGAEPERVQKALERLNVVDCEMKAGDALLFHANTLHASIPNTSDKTRVILHCTYNGISNEPYKEEWKKNHGYEPLVKLSDSTLKEGHYNGIFKNEDFYPSENEKNRAAGITFRGSKEAK